MRPNVEEPRADGPATEGDEAVRVKSKLEFTEENFNALVGAMLFSTMSFANINETLAGLVAKISTNTVTIDDVKAAAHSMGGVVSLAANVLTQYANEMGMPE